VDAEELVLGVLADAPCGDREAGEAVCVVPDAGDGARTSGSSGEDAVAVAN